MTFVESSNTTFHCGEMKDSNENYNKYNPYSKVEMIAEVAMCTIRNYVSSKPFHVLPTIGT